MKKLKTLIGKYLTAIAVIGILIICFIGFVLYGIKLLIVGDE